MRRALLPVIALCLGLAGCSGGGGKTPTPTPTATPTSAIAVPTGAAPTLRAQPGATSFDARNPLMVRANVGPSASKDAVAGDRTTLAGTTLYGINRAGQLMRVPLATGEAAWTLALATASGAGQPEPTASATTPWADDKGPSAPIVSADGMTVYGAIAQTIWGPKDVTGIAVVAAESTTGREKWRVLVPLKQNLVPADTQRVRTSLSSNGLLVVTPTESILLDPATGKTIWQIDGFAALGNGKMGLWAATGGASAAWVFDAGTGKRTEVWVVQKMQDAPTWIGEAAGSQVFTIPGTTPVMVVMDAASGTVKSKHGHWSFNDCQFLEKGSTVTVCSPGNSLSGVDVTQDKPLWSFYKPKMVVPAQPYRLGKLVYGVVDGKGVALDLATGQTLNADTGAKVFRANEYGGLGFAGQGLAFFPAKG